MEPERSVWREWFLIAVLAAVQVVHIVDFVIMMPLGPQLMREFGIGPREFSLIVSSYTFSAAVSGLAAAFFLDRFDRRSALVLLLAGFALGTASCAWAPTYPFLVGARIFAGAFGGVLAAVVFAIIGDEVPPDRRGTATGVVMTGFSVASVAGLPLGLALAARTTWHQPFLVLAAVTVGVLLLARFGLPPMRRHLDAPRRSPLAEVLEVVREPLHHRAFALTVMLMLGGFSLSPFIAPYLVANVGVAESQLSLVYLAGGIATLVSGPLTGKLSDRFGAVPVFLVAAPLSILPVLALTHLGRVPLWLALLVTTGLMVGMNARFVPAMATLTGTVAPRLRGGFMSVNSSVQQMAAGVAAAGAGLIVGGSEATGLTNFGLVGWLAAVATLLCLPLMMRLRAGQAHAAALAAAPASDAPPLPAGRAARP